MSATKTATVAVGDLDIFYHEAGAGTPLVLLHGGIVTAEMMFGRRIAELAKDYHVLAPDSRGHGRTGNPDGALSYARMADDVAGFIDRLGIERPHIVGYSDGGQIALEFGMRHPGRARTLVLGGTISHMSGPYLEALHGWGFLAPGRVDYAALEAAWDEFFTTVKGLHGPADEPDYWTRFIPQVSELWLTVPAYSDAQLERVTDPTLVMMGDRDGADGLDHARRLYTGVACGELAIVPNSPHGAVERDIFWDIVRDFHRRHGKIT